MNFSNKKTFKKILVVRLSSMGDILLTTPFIRVLRNHFIDAQIDFAVSGSFLEILKYNPHISNIFSHDKKLDNKTLIKQRNEFLLENRVEQYDLVFDLQRNLRSKLFIRGISKKVYKVKKNRLNKLSLVYFKRQLLKNFDSVPENYIKTGMDIGVKDDGEGLELWFSEEKETAEYSLGLKSNKFRDIQNLKIAIAPGAYHKTKRWLPERFVELTENLKSKFKCEISLLGGKDDKSICKEIIKSASVKINDHSGSDSILETARILDKCNLLITNDTGVMHIGAARKIPVVAIFGSTVPEFGFVPFRVPSMVISKNLRCRPCTHIGRSKCPKKHFDCMKQISVDEVLHAIEILFKENRIHSD